MNNKKLWLKISKLHPQSESIETKVGIDTTNILYKKLEEHRCTFLLKRLYIAEFNG